MKRRTQSGATIVEAAVVILLLFTMVFAIMEFGIVALRYHTLTNAAREGARFGSVPCQSGDAGNQSCTFQGITYQSGIIPPPDAVVAYVQNYLRAAGIPVDANTTTVTVTPEWQILSGSANGAGFNMKYRYLTVQVDSKYKFAFFRFGTLPLRATSVMKNEIDIQE